MTHRQSAIAHGRGHSLRTPETNDALGCSSWALVSLREYNVAGLAEYACETYRRQCFNVEIMRETSICIVTENEESDVPDKRQHDGIGGEASVNVAIGGEISVNVAYPRNKWCTRL